MSIDYCCVARDKTILVQQANISGNCESFVGDVLAHLDSSQPRSTYDTNQLRYYVLHDKGGLNFCATGSVLLKPKDAFEFLEAIQRLFIIQYGKTWKQLPLYGAQQGFIEKLRGQMDAEREKKISKIKSNLCTTEAQMSQNYQQVLLRGQDIDDLAGKSEEIATSANDFQRTAIDLKYQMTWQKCKFYILALVVMIAVVYFVMAIACKGFAFQGCVKNRKYPPTHNETNTTHTSNVSNLL